MAQKMFRKFVNCVKDNFLAQLERKSTRRGALLHLLLTKREELVRDMQARNCLGQRDYKTVEFLVKSGGGSAKLNSNSDPRDQYWGLSYSISLRMT